MRKLTDNDIQKIEDLLEKKDVIYYDLKMELLDHISSSIEDQWQKNPNLSFTTAFHNEYKNFGIHGFSELMEKREQDLNTYYWKSIGRHMFNWLKIPQIFFTILLGYGLFQIMQSEYNIIFRNVFVFSCIGLGIIQFLVYFISKRKKKQKNQPILLMDKIIAKASGSLYFIYMLIQNTIVTIEKKVFSDVEAVGWTLFLTILSLLFYHILYDFPRNKKQYFRSNFNWA